MDTDMNPKVSKRKKNFGGGYMKYVFLIVLAGVIVGGFWLRDNNNLVVGDVGTVTEGVASSDNVTDVANQEISQQEIEKALRLVSRHIILPENEFPVMASIINADELIKEQPFYANTINGDILFIYSQNRRAILYSPERDILVNVGPINIGDQ